MAIREVLQLPNDVLKTRATEARGDDVGDLVTDLIDTMRASPACVGLAANQIGSLQRVFVADVTGHPKAETCHGLIVCIDPEIVAIEGVALAREGCMSVPDLTGDVPRPARVVLEATNAAGERVEIDTDAFEARALMHELDHLDGTLFLDRAMSQRSVFQRKTYR